ncbi:VCBS repeat-containing protein [Blastococcus montanus]|uniref:FG-GAP repeat domain-containing protein n=1 Tax=Blastococcus montanus TaxID=3144973 RepID=UPI00320B61D8
MTIALITGCGTSTPAGTAGGGVTFQEVSPWMDTRDYSRVPSPEHERRVAHAESESVGMPDLMTEPVHDRGIPGVVIRDFDGDGHLDIYATNGPGRDNSLYRNRLGELGRLAFVDVGAGAGAGLRDADTNGACSGDVDNDGAPDLYVLGRNQSNHLLVNRGDGTFDDVTDQSGTGGGEASHVSCTMADFDGDGLLDIAVANSFDMVDGSPITTVPFERNQADQLFRNEGDNRFTDVSESSGFAYIDNSQQAGAAPVAGITWAIAAVDYDRDGDPDLITGTDQGMLPHAKNGGIDRGFVRVFRNNGSGAFREVTRELGLAEPGAWMGLAIGDFNVDGRLDLFASNSGDYMQLNMPPGMQGELGDMSSRWFLQRADGTFADPRRSTLPVPAEDGEDPTLGGLGATPFGWGATTFDYDNDGATDILFHGGMDPMSYVTADNPGALLRNLGPDALRDDFFPTFAFDDAIARSGTDHRRRVVTGVASGDLDENGFVDVVTVAQGRSTGPLHSYARGLGSPFDDGAAYLTTYRPVEGSGGMQLTPTDSRTVPGDLSVELNRGNAHGSATVTVMGTVGLTETGRVNRDGVGAVVAFTPRDGETVLRPVIAGASFASQDSLRGTFGMGAAAVATVTVDWPGGVRNVLYDVRPGERIVFPEIPCPLELRPDLYTGCVGESLDALVGSGHLVPAQADRFLRSAMRARSDNG